MRTLFAIFGVLLCKPVLGQQNVFEQRISIQSMPIASALLQLGSSAKAMIIPPIPSDPIQAIPNGAEGLFIYNEQAGKFQVLTYSSSLDTAGNDAFSASNDIPFNNTSALTFTPNVDGEITKIELFFTSVGFGNTQLQIYEALPPGCQNSNNTHIAQSNTLPPVNNQWNAFVFSTRPQVIAGQTYFISISNNLPVSIAEVTAGEDPRTGRLVSGVNCQQSSDDYAALIYITNSIASWEDLH